MRHSWLTLFGIAALAAIILLFFRLELRPVEMPEKNDASDDLPFLEQPTVTFLNPSLGSKNAKITIVEFADFTCRACKSLVPTLEEIRRAHPNDVRVVWKHAPNDTLDNRSTPASIAAQCAFEQGKFWEYHDALFARRLILSSEQFLTIANELSLEIEPFQTCIESQNSLPSVRKDAEEAQALGLQGVPALFINGKRFEGAVSFPELSAYVSSLLER